jgi:hypothetical protein
MVAIVAMVVNGNQALLKLIVNASNIILTRVIPREVPIAIGSTRNLLS